jgi:hypothetical protein
VITARPASTSRRAFARSYSIRVRMVISGCIWWTHRWKNSTRKDSSRIFRCQKSVTSWTVGSTSGPESAGIPEGPEPPEDGPGTAGASPEAAALPTEEPIEEPPPVATGLKFHSVPPESTDEVVLLSFWGFSSNDSLLSAGFCRS